MAGNIVKIISKEMIKPSTPTPHHLREHKLSMLDQMAPPVYVPIIFFYDKPNQCHSEISQLLKQSLSDVLTKFYPLAGRVNEEEVVIDCNDAGALFVDAQAVDDHNAHHLWQQVNIDDEKRRCCDVEALRQLLPLPVVLHKAGGGGEILLAIQMNFFAGMGMAIGVQISHVVADAHSLVIFMNTWAASCHARARGDHDDMINITNGVFSNLQPSFDMACHTFPPRDLSRFGVSPTISVAITKSVTTHFVFTKQELDKIKKELAAAATVAAAVSSCSSTSITTATINTSPTRVEAVSALIWKHLIEVAKAGTSAAVRKSSGLVNVAIHPVNVRPKMSPALPDQAFGNIFTESFALLLPDEDEENPHPHYLASKFRSAIRNIDNNYIMKLAHRGDDFLSPWQRFIEAFPRQEVELSIFSSWCRFPVYEVDYGWGKPVWVCTTNMPLSNMTTLMSTRSGDGIEAWINIPEDEASICQNPFTLNYNFN